MSVKSSTVMFCFKCRCQSAMSLFRKNFFFTEAWTYKKKKHKKITAYKKSVRKEPTVKRCLLILDLESPRL